MSLLTMCELLFTMWSLTATAVDGYFNLMNQSNLTDWLYIIILYDIIPFTDNFVVDYFLGQPVAITRSFRGVRSHINLLPSPDRFCLRIVLCKVMNLYTHPEYPTGVRGCFPQSDLLDSSTELEVYTAPCTTFDLKQHNDDAFPHHALRLRLQRF